MVSELDKMTDSPGARNALEIIRRNVELEARLIDDLLDITRIAHGKLQLTPETDQRAPGDPSGAGDLPAGHRRETPRGAAGPRGVRFPCEGGPRPLPAGALEPDQERGEIHAEGLDHHPLDQQWQPAGWSSRSTDTGIGITPGAAGADIQALRAGGKLDHAAVWRAGARAGDLQGDDRGARRGAEGAQPGHGPGIDLYRGTGDRGCADGSRGGRRARRRSPAARCSTKSCSWTITRIPAPACG